jgi:hypothetical protein
MSNQSSGEGRSEGPAQACRPAADPAGYYAMRMRFETMKKAFPKLNHRGHEPKPNEFGLTQREAAIQAELVRREVQRKQ